MTLMAADNAEAKARICGKCMGAGKVFTFAVPPGERTTRAMWVSCPACNRPLTPVKGP